MLGERTGLFLRQCSETRSLTTLCSLSPRVAVKSTPATAVKADVLSVRDSSSISPQGGGTWTRCGGLFFPSREWRIMHDLSHSGYCLSAYRTHLASNRVRRCTVKPAIFYSDFYVLLGLPAFRPVPYYPPPTRNSLNPLRQSPEIAIHAVGMGLHKRPRIFFLTSNSLSQHFTTRAVIDCHTYPRRPTSASSCQISAFTVSESRGRSASLSTFSSKLLISSFRRVRRVLRFLNMHQFSVRTHIFSFSTLP